MRIQYIRSCTPYLQPVSSIRNSRTRHVIVSWTRSVWSGWIRLGIGTRGGLLWVRWWNFRFHKTRAICPLVKQRSAVPEGLLHQRPMTYSLDNYATRMRLYATQWFCQTTLTSLVTFTALALWLCKCYTNINICAIHGHTGTNLSKVFA